MTPVSTTSALFFSFAFDSASVLFDFRSIASRAAGRLFVLIFGDAPFQSRIICHEDLVSLAAWDMIWMRNVRPSFRVAESGGLLCCAWWSS